MSSQSHPDQSADGPAGDAKHPGPSRRSVLYGAAGLAGAGLAATAIGTLAAPAAAASASAEYLPGNPLCRAAADASAEPLPANLTAAPPARTGRARSTTSL